MKNDFYEKRVFANKLQGIDLIQLDKEERNNLLIKKNILVQRKVDLSHDYFKNAKKNNTFIEKAFEINPLIYKEIISDFLYTHSELDLFYEMKMIDLKTEGIDRSKEKIKSLKKIIKKKNKELQKVNLYFWSKLTPKEYVDYGERDFHDHITLELKKENIYSYLTNEFVSYYQIHPFDEWIKILDLEELIKFCNKKINIILKSKVTPSKEEKKTNIKPYYSEIWKEEKYETMFRDYLKYENVIDSNNNPKTGFKDSAGVLLRIKPRILAEITKKRVTRKLFATYLNKKYNANIEIKSGFKIGNSDYLTEDCEGYIENFLSPKKRE